MLLVLLLGFLVGTTLGVMGGGGSMLAIPLLTYGLGLEPREAITTSLVVVALAALAGAVHHWRRGLIDFRCAAVFGLLGFLGSVTGAQAARHLVPGLQMTLFAATLISTAIVMLRGPRHPPLRKEAAGVLPTALAATGAGLVTGVAGVGGGFIVVPALVFVTGMPMQRAVGTALLVIVFNAVGGLASYSAYVSIDRTIWAPFAAAAMISAMAGTFLGRRLGEKRLRTVFAVGLLVLGLFTIVKEGFLA